MTLDEQLDIESPIEISIRPNKRVKKIHIEIELQ